MIKEDVLPFFFMLNEYNNSPHLIHTNKIFAMLYFASVGHLQPLHLHVQYPVATSTTYPTTIRLPVPLDGRWIASILVVFIFPKSSQCNLHPSKLSLYRKVCVVPSYKFIYYLYKAYCKGLDMREVLWNEAYRD